MAIFFFTPKSKFMKRNNTFNLILTNLLTSYWRIIFALFFLIFFQISVSQNHQKIKLKKHRICYLSDTVIETSGLSFRKNRIYTLNDSGNPNKIYEINTATGNIIKTYETNLSNMDWEAIAFDKDTLYIGDFGNNSGNRKNLSISKLILKDSISYTTFTTLPFEYAHQKEFSNRPLQHNFDCEAMIVRQGKIHLFSKEWQSKKTSHYILEASRFNKQSLTKTEELDMHYLVTDACFFENKVYLIGYTKMGKVFLTILKCDENLNITTAHYTKIKLGSVLNLGQVEGIAVNSNGIYISSEGFHTFIFNSKPSLYFISFSDL